MKLYKYTEKKYMEGLLERGSLRIGTLYDYRRADAGKMVTDEREGIKTFSGNIAHANEHDVRNNAALSLLISLGPGTTAHINNVSFSNCSVDTGNLYIFSASSSYEESTHKRWYAEEKYDCCYRITSALLFFKAISAAIKDRASFCGFRKVVYYDHSVGVNVNSPLINLHPGVFKAGKDYGMQNEVRAFWKPVGNSLIEPFIVEIVDVIQYCSRFRCLNH